MLLRILASLFFFTRLLSVRAEVSDNKFLSKPLARDYVKEQKESSNIFRGMKGNVYPSDELKFYEKVNQIDPAVLRILMSNVTEGPPIVIRLAHCCYNGGTCNVPSNDPRDRWCFCTTNFTGRYCDMDVDECKLPDACDEHQRCENTYGSYKCHCEDGFVEENLKCTRKTTCLEDPCLNFADCIDIGEGRVFCVCRLGYSGERCEKKLPECGDSSCAQGDVCIATPRGFECVKVS